MIGEVQAVSEVRVAEQFSSVWKSPNESMAELVTHRVQTLVVASIVKIAGGITRSFW